MSNNGLLSLAAGFGNGMITQKRRAEEDGRLKEDRDMAREERQLRLDDARQQRRQNAAVAEAGKPVAVQELPATDMAAGEMGPSPTAPSLGGFKVGANTYHDREQADTAVAAENTPDAQAGRIAKAYRENGAPEKALTLENANMSQKRAAQQFDQQQIEHAKKLKEEGVFAAARALRSGNAAEFASAFNASGKTKLEGQPEIVKEEREIPGIGKVPTFTAKFMMRREDGSITEETRNSHDLSMQLLPFEKVLELQRKGTDSDNKAQYQTAMLDAKVKQLELAGQVAEAKALKAAAGGGAIGREERLRFTSLFSDAGRRMGEAQRALSSLQKDPLFMMNARKAGTQEAGQLSELQDSIKTYGEERSLYQGLLAGSSATPAKPSLSDAQPKTPAAKPKAAGNTDFSNLWK